MPLQEGIEQNFRFLVLEVGRQLDSAERVLDGAPPKLAEEVASADDRVDNLKGVIEGKCFTLTLQSRGDKRRIDLLKAVDVATANLERIADFAVNVVGQQRYLTDPAFIRRFDYAAHFREVRRAVALVFEALFERNVTLALQICEAEFNLDRLFAADFARVMAGLKSGREVENHVTTLFILRYFERMGDSLLNVGEAILSAAMGERLKIHQFQALEESLEAVDDEADLERFAFESMGETRSGCRIARIAPREKGAGEPLIFKEGNLKKLRRERENLERWNALAPGLPPKVLAFHEHGEGGSLLMECIDGETLQDLALQGSEETLRGAMRALAETLAGLWPRTRRAGAIRSDFLRQTRKRLPEVYDLHPSFKRAGQAIGGAEAPSFEELLDRAEALEEKLPAPFATFIHGDFNVDNILFSRRDGRIRFIDLYRSRDKDYVQDVSVFLVSNFRMPVFDRDARRRLGIVIEEMLRFGAEFARAAEDGTYAARLALGLARSFATSARFVVDEGFARALFLRARYLLEKFAAHEGRDWAAFALPADVLEY